MRLSWEHLSTDAKEILVAYTAKVPRNKLRVVWSLREWKFEDYRPPAKPVVRETTNASYGWRHKRKTGGV